MNYQQLIKSELTEAANLLEQFLSDENQLKSIERAANMIVQCIQNGGKVFSCGNGGSSCDASHFAEEMTGKFREDRDPFPAIAISDPGHITCTSNDYGYERIFSRFLRGLGNQGDVLLALSTSGNSENLLLAAEYAQQKGIKVIALTGKKGGKLADFADIEIRVPHNGYSDRIQELHMKVLHILILLIEQKTTDVS